VDAVKCISMRTGRAKEEERRGEQPSLPQENHKKTRAYSYTCQELHWLGCLWCERGASIKWKRIYVEACSTGLDWTGPEKHGLSLRKTHVWLGYLWQFTIQLPVSFVKKSFSKKLLQVQEQQGKSQTKRPFNKSKSKRLSVNRDTKRNLCSQGSATQCIQERLDT